jgi:hypothetical protein
MRIAVRNYEPLRGLRDLQNAAGFELPEDEAAALAVVDAAAALTLPDPPPMRHTSDAASQVVDDLVAGGDVDVLATAAELAANRKTAADIDEAQVLVGDVLTQAAERAVAVAHSHATAIIEETLSPVFDEALGEAKKSAEMLQSNGLSPLEPTLVSESPSAKLRSAARRFRELAEQVNKLRTARFRACLVGDLTAADDTIGDFLVYRHPERLVPSWSPNGSAPLRVPKLPTDSVAALWSLTTTGMVAEPWLPSPRQCDEQWVAMFGEARARRGKAANDARALAGR